ncbi:hypothetical protein IKS57_04365 [bacterium]|nr:hypothetical protein [bacterium]
MKNKYLETVIFAKKDIQNAIKETAKTLNKELKGNRSPIVVIGVLDGCSAFFGQLLTQLKFSLVTDFVKVESFNGEEERSHEPELKLNIQEETRKFIKNKEVLIIDDVISSGATSKMLYDKIMSYGAKEVRFAFLLDQENSNRIKMDFAYTAALKAPSSFLVGYGLDYKGKYRNLDCIGNLKEKYLKK